MDEAVFRALAKDAVYKYAMAHVDATEQPVMAPEGVYVVWECKTLQNNKALLSTTLSDGMYYEVTYNGDKKQMYLDAYKKFENVCYEGVE